MQLTVFERELRTRKFRRDFAGIPDCILPSEVCDQIMELARESIVPEAAPRSPDRHTAVNVKDEIEFMQSVDAKPEAAGETPCGNKFTGASGRSIFTCVLPKDHPGDCDDAPNRGNLVMRAGETGAHKNAGRGESAESEQNKAGASAGQGEPNTIADGFKAPPLRNERPAEIRGEIGKPALKGQLVAFGGPW